VFHLLSNPLRIRFECEYSAGKSTSLSVIAGLSSITGGTVTFEGGVSRPGRGTLGIVPQKNVLFPELTCMQTLQVWKAVKWSKNSLANEDMEQLLRDCDLGGEINANAATLSGGQKRKLQLAIGLLGGCKGASNYFSRSHVSQKECNILLVVLVDECTSGVDPLSRRALWKTLTSFREDRSILFTTHVRDIPGSMFFLFCFQRQLISQPKFLDEADLLADYIAILAAPGKVVASGPPVVLKRDLGEGYSMQVSFGSSVIHEKTNAVKTTELLQNIRPIAPYAYVSTLSRHQSCFHLKMRDPNAVRQVLELLDDEMRSGHITSYDILGTTIEDIFLDLMAKNEATEDEKPYHNTSPSPLPNAARLDLPIGRPVSPFKQAFTIFHKRLLIARRSWLTPVLTILVAVAGACIPLVFIAGKQQSCVRRFRNTTSIPLYFPSSPIVPFTLGTSSRVLMSPPDIIQTLGSSTNFFRTTNTHDNATFVDSILQNYRNLSLGGISIDTSSGASLVAWEASPPGLTGPTMLNLASNILYNRALNASGNGARTPSLIRANYASFPPLTAGTLVSLRWIAFFGAVMVHAFSISSSQLTTPSRPSTLLSLLSMSQRNVDPQCKLCSSPTD